MIPILKDTYMPTLSGNIFNEDLFDSLFTNNQAKTSVPKVNIAENKDEYRIEVAAPGLKKDDFKIELDHSIIRIFSEKNEEHEETEEKYTKKEFNFCSFTRSFNLPDSIEASKINANYKDGILNVIIPKKEEAKEKPPRMINIQ